MIQMDTINNDVSQAFVEDSPQELADYYEGLPDDYPRLVVAISLLEDALEEAQGEERESLEEALEILGNRYAQFS